ncbi:hypothetical protein EVAR_19150_1 [Eumeta japonica]|uniref:Uncharacterized protein n=1 Tax=Eumeta variegata TaxID=151549 RepID=A0A4C1VMU7_EUMVA|nr:hypothetical protein EVAR_19150_1 [Eumeta japonica]
MARERSTSKRMIASFVNKTGHVATVALKNCRTVNSDLYTTIFLPEIIDELRKNNRYRRIILHHDNPVVTWPNKQINCRRRKMKTYEQRHKVCFLKLCFVLFAKIKHVVNDFHHQKRPSMSMKHMVRGHLKGVV